MPCICRLDARIHLKAEDLAGAQHTLWLICTCNTARHGSQVREGTDKRRRLAARVSERNSRVARQVYTLAALGGRSGDGDSPFSCPALSPGAAEEAHSPIALEDWQDRMQMQNPDWLRLRRRNGRGLGPTATGPSSISDTVVIWTQNSHGRECFKPWGAAECAPATVTVSAT